MADEFIDINKRKQKVIELTSFMLHKHYCENDVDAIVMLFDDPLSWVGAGENEFSSGRDEIIGIFRHFKGLIPKCNLSDEKYEVIAASPDIYICIGRLWVTTDPSTDMYLRVHQRITVVFRWVNGQPRCCHIHNSNPYTEMTETEIGFPTKISKYSYQYLQECIEEQKKKIDAQTELLRRISYEDPLTGLFNRYKFNQRISECEERAPVQLGVVYFDLNGLKEVNDKLGHSAGDDLIRRTAEHISRFFSGKAYRIGGDEFVVIDEAPDEKTFLSIVCSICENMKQDDISISVGVSWRQGGCKIMEQVEEADERMRLEKMQYYSSQGHNRRKHKI